MSIHKEVFKSNDLTITNPVIFKALESLIQNLKNNQRCFAEAAALVNSSQLRNLFTTIELERTMFMEVTAKAIERSDLILGKHSYNADVAWFSSIMLNNRSKEEFDFEILSRCMQCEESIYQAYDYVMDLRAGEQIFVFLDKQKLKLERTEQRLQTLHDNLQTVLT